MVPGESPRSPYYCLSLNNSTCHWSEESQEDKTSPLLPSPHPPCSVLVSIISTPTSNPPSLPQALKELTIPLVLKQCLKKVQFHPLN